MAPNSPKKIQPTKKNKFDFIILFFGKNGQIAREKKPTYFGGSGTFLTPKQLIDEIWQSENHFPFPIYFFSPIFFSPPEVRVR